MDICTRCKDNVHAIFQNFITHVLTHLFYEIEIPCRRQHCGDRITGAIECAGIPFSCWRDSQTCRTVGKYHSRNAQTWDAVDNSSSSGNTCIGVTYSVEALCSSTNYEGTFLLRSHRSHNLLDIIFSKLWCFFVCNLPYSKQGRNQ